MKALEFFSGIGAFAEAARAYGIEVEAAFDQNQHANEVYNFNFGQRPCTRNLDTITIQQVPQAQLWWMSPPCTPFSVRGNRRDEADPRARCFLNLIDLATIAQPDVLAVENVLGFCKSKVEAYLKERLQAHGYRYRSFNLCPTAFGVPMRRPRHFVLMSRHELVLPTPILNSAQLSLADFLHETDNTLYLDEETLARYGQGFDIVDPLDPDASLICFTKNYARCMKASGSLLRTARGIRRLSPEEILLLFGFNKQFRFPEEIGRDLRWRMVGNSVDVRAIQYVLQSVTDPLCQDVGVMPYGSKPE